MILFIIIRIQSFARCAIWQPFTLFFFVFLCCNLRTEKNPTLPLTGSTLSYSVINLLYDSKMSGNRYSQETKDAVELLRKAGKTYNEIRKIHPIPKSTLSVWLGEKYAGIFDREAQLAHLKRIQGLARAKLHENKVARNALYASRGVATAQLLATENIGFQKALLAMLYW